MAGGSNGYRAALVRDQLTPGLISSLPETAGSPPFISSSTSYPELDSAVPPGPQWHLLGATIWSAMALPATFTLGTPRGLFGSIDLMATHSPSVSS